MKLVITGAAGLLGWHLRCVLLTRQDIEVTVLDRAAFNNDQELAAALHDVDAVIHLAGMNRGDNDEILATNIALAKRLVAGCEASGCRPHIAYSNSTHVDRDTPYGASKRGAAEVFQRWSDEGGGKFSNIILPHIFGEHGRPFYNSVVSTFAHQLAKDETPAIDQDGQLELLHAQDAGRILLAAVDGGHTGEERPPGEKMRVSELLERLEGLKSSYSQHIVPDLREPMQLRLFNVYRSYLFPGYYPRALTLHSDERGDLFEAVKNLNGGQAFLSTTHPGITRGNHFHFRKVERFLVVRGQATIRLRRLFSDEVHEFAVSGDQPSYIDMPTLHTHNITNTGNEELMTLFWAHEIFDPEHPDTVFEEV